MRRYGKWAGNPNGTPEDPRRCVAEIAESGRACLFHQCCRNRGKGPGGLYCGIHARQLSLGRYVCVPHAGADEPEGEEG